MREGVRPERLGPHPERGGVRRLQAEAFATLARGRQPGRKYALAFGQTVAKTSAVEHTGHIQRAPTQITSGAVKIGTVTAFNAGVVPIEPPSPIVVQSSPDTKPVSYVLGKRVRFTDRDGRAVDPHLVRPGTRVQLGFDRRGRVARVTVIQKG